MKSRALIVLAAAALGCEERAIVSVPPPEVTISTTHTKTTTSRASEHDSGRCPSIPKTVTGTAYVGAECKDAADCAPACCPCPDSRLRRSAAACINGVCMGAEVACARDDTAEFCADAHFKRQATISDDNDCANESNAKRRAAGFECDQAEDCAWVCCGCKNGKGYSAAVCINYSCVGGNAACEHTASSCE